MSPVRYPLRFICGLVVVSLLNGCALQLPIGASEPADVDVAQPSGEVPSDALFALSSRADTAYAESRWIDAVRSYQRVVEQVPQDATAWFRLGNTYAQQGAYDRAIHAYETSILHDANQPKPWFNLSTTYLLKAQNSMRRAHQRLRAGDPARHIIDKRLEHLGLLVHGRFEDSATTAVSR